MLPGMAASGEMRRLLPLWVWFLTSEPPFYHAIYRPRSRKSEYPLILTLTQHFLVHLDRQSESNMLV